MSPFGKKTPSCPRVTALCAVSLILVKSYKAKNFICTMSVVFRDLEFTHLVSKSMLHSRLLPRNPPIRPWHHDTTRVWDNTTYVYTRSLGALKAPTSSWRPFGPLEFVLCALLALRAVRRARLRSGPVKIGHFFENGAFFRKRCIFFKIGHFPRYHHVTVFLTVRRGLVGGIGYSSRLM